MRSIAKYLETPCSDALAGDIVQSCKIEKMRSANRDKFDDRNQTPPNPEMNNPDLMYRKGCHRVYLSLFLFKSSAF